jgi:hypothetical protein
MLHLKPGWYFFLVAAVHSKIPSALQFRLRKSGNRNDHEKGK